jgi:hypothetical protein
MGCGAADAVLAIIITLLVLDSFLARNVIGPRPECSFT